MRESKMMVELLRTVTGYRMITTQKRTNSTWGHPENPRRMKPTGKLLFVIPDVFALGGREG